MSGGGAQYSAKMNFVISINICCRNFIMLFRKRTWFGFFSPIIYARLPALHFLALWVDNIGLPLPKRAIVVFEINSLNRTL